MEWRRETAASPGELGWWIAVLFMGGAFLFALGSFPLYSQLVDPDVVGVTFVLGSVLFTSAAYCQFVQVVNGVRRAGSRVRLIAWQPRRILWWATAVQLIGTLLFNFNTIDSMIEGLTTEETNRLVWAPDIFGSIAFLIASHLAWVDVCDGWWEVRRDDADWWAAGLNYVGSMFFMLAALASVVLPTTGESLNTTLVNSGTFLGAVCFFVGAYVLLPSVSRSASGTG